MYKLGIIGITNQLNKYMSIFIQLITQKIGRNSLSPNIPLHFHKSIMIRILVNRPLDIPLSQCLYLINRLHP